MIFQFKIRRDALNGLGQLYKVVTMAESVSQEHLDKIVWVKNKIFHAYYQQNPEDRSEFCLYLTSLKVIILALLIKSNNPRKYKT